MWDINKEIKRCSRMTVPDEPKRKKHAKETNKKVEDADEKEEQRKPMIRIHDDHAERKITKTKNGKSMRC